MAGNGDEATFSLALATGLAVLDAKLLLLLFRVCVCELLLTRTALGAVCFLAASVEVDAVEAIGSFFRLIRTCRSTLLADRCFGIGLGEGGTDADGDETNVCSYCSCTVDVLLLLVFVIGMFVTGPKFVAAELVIVVVVAVASLVLFVVTIVDMLDMLSAVACVFLILP